MKFEDLRRFFKNAIAPLQRKVNLMVSRAVISSIKDEGGLQLLQLKLLADEVTDDAEHFQEFGFKSKPPMGSEGIALSVGGNREHVVVVASLNRAAVEALPTLADGESIFFTNTGNYYHMKADNHDIKCIGKYLVDSTDNVEMKAPKFKFENASNELIDVLVQWITQHIANKNITAIGPQPLQASDIALMNAIKTKLESFKV